MRCAIAIGSLRSTRRWPIEAYAHEQFGWVKEGEETASVRGLDLPEEGSTFRANIVSDSIEAPETWYSTLLDPLFGVE